MSVSPDSAAEGSSAAAEGSSAVELILGGETFRIQPGEAVADRLVEVAQFVNERLAEIQDKTNALSLQRAALMTAFQFAYEMKELESWVDLPAAEASSISERIDQIISRIDESLDEVGPGDDLEE